MRVGFGWFLIPHFSKRHKDIETSHFYLYSLKTITAESITMAYYQHGFIGRLKSLIADYKNGKEYPRHFIYQDKEIIKDDVYLMAFTEMCGDMYINQDSGYPLSQEDINDLLIFLKDLKKRAYRQKDMPQIIVDSYLNEIAEYDKQYKLELEKEIIELQKEKDKI